MTDAPITDAAILKQRYRLHQNDTLWQDIELFAANHAAEERAKVVKLREALLMHNDVLRSACSIAGRNGEATNWLSFRGRCHYTLAEYHELVNEARGDHKEKTHAG